jgi:hypothetical protein
MYDKGKIIPGLLIFVALATFPIWYSSALGKAGDTPQLKPPPDPINAVQCVEPKEIMRASHMQLLFDWRETVVREGNRTYRASDGKEYNMSLTGECMSCHSNKAEFCDQCHNYLKVKPYCWDCHVIPKENV